MKHATAFSPGHITGFFQICDRFVDEAQTGSRGAGVSIRRGVTTRVRVLKSQSNRLTIVINGRISRAAPVSELVVKEFLFRVGEKYEVCVDHHIDVPVGQGFGSSGAGALSLALAMNEVFDLKLDRFEAAAVAHAVEIKCKTGLGTVISETVGGLEIRVKPGAPGVGRVLNIPLQDRYSIACLPIGPIYTKDVLTDSILRRRIQLGGRYVDRLLLDPSLENFMAFSRQFAESVGLISKRLRKILTQTDRAGIMCSMAMIGETLFTIAKSDQVEEVRSILNRSSRSRSRMIVSGIDLQGARVL